MPQVKDHFASPQWVDLVRGQLSGGVADEMDVHLRAGCTECMTAFDVWQGLAVFAQEERGAAPPEDAIRVAKTYLARQTLTQSAEGPLARASAILATLVFDSLQTAPAGVRAAAASSRHVVFNATPLVVDLHVDTVPFAGGLILSGQVADASHPDQPLENIWLSLTDEHEEFGRFQTNEFGEFYRTLDHRANLKLNVHAKHHVVAVPLDSLFNPSNAQGRSV